MISFRHLVSALPLAIVLLLAACGAGGTSNSAVVVGRIDDMFGATAPIAHTLIASSDNSGVMEARNVVIKDGDAWAALWAEHSARESPAPAPPEVDLRTEMVIAVFIGTRPSGCYGAEFVDVSRAGGLVQVRYRETLLAPTVVCSQSVVMPARMIKLARTDEMVKFIAEPIAVGVNL